MIEIIKKIPLPISGLILALAAMANLYSPYSVVYKNAFASMSIVLLLFLIIRYILSPEEIIEGLNNPLMSTIFPTFTMALMIISTFAKQINYSFALALWMTALILHVYLIINHSVKHLFPFDIKKIHPSIFLVYVGIVTTSVTAPAFNMLIVGEIVFYFGMTSYFVLLPIVLFRVFIVKSIGEPLFPLFGIMAAPASLCLAGYLSSFSKINSIVLYLLIFLSLFMFLFVLLKIPQFIKSKFYPSISGFTFPFVISAIAMKKANTYFLTNHLRVDWFRSIVLLEEIIAVLIVFFVLYAYMRFLLVKRETVVLKEMK